MIIQAPVILYFLYQDKIALRIKSGVQTKNRIFKFLSLLIFYFVLLSLNVSHIPLINSWYQSYINNYESNVAGNAKEALALSKMQEQTLQSENHKKIKVGRPLQVMQLFLSLFVMFQQSLLISIFSFFMVHP